MASKDTYSKLIDYLDKNKAKYRLIDHAPEGRTEIVSGMRGNKVSAAAKCMVLMAKLKNKTTKYVLGVIPGDAKINLNAVKELFNATYVSFATPEIAEKLAESVSGTILPFSFNGELELIVDPQLQENEEIFFNAARLDRSMALNAKDYLRLSTPRFEKIAASAAASVGQGQQSTGKAKLDKSSQLYRIRHSCSHALAQAVLLMFPEAKLGIGPPIENGFYYDFELPRTLIPEDLQLLEEKMREVIKQKQTFVRREEPINKALEFLKKAKQPYKMDLAEGWKKEGSDKVSFYENVDKDGHVKFVDLCEGNHLDNLGEIKAFKLLHTAGAYWRGDEKNKMLQRIYGTAFETKEELDVHLHQLEEAKKRDHKILGKQLGLFTHSALVGGGLPLFLPKGAKVKKLLEDYIIRQKESRGYSFVGIPHIAKEDLYIKSGHLGKYDAMMPIMEMDDGDRLVMKAMNCPHHFELYRAQAHSYRQLPLRYAENTTVYRNEKSGELNGLLRVRALEQDDTHHFVRHEQIASEIEMILGLTKEVYEHFGFKKYRARVSTRDLKKKDKYFGSDKLWALAEEKLIESVKAWGAPYFVGEGEAAFYGPKIDIMLEDAIGREWQLTTVQLDFTQPENFDLSYTGEDGKQHRPAVLHVAILGSYERFMAILIEHFSGAFPFWLAPVQAAVLPVSDDFLEYAHTIEEILKNEGYRVEVDDSAEGLGKKIRNAELMKIPYMIVVGEKEVAAQTIAVRDYATKKQEVMKVKEFLGKIKS